MINITKNEVNFNDLEKKVWKAKMKEGLDELKKQLKSIDLELLKAKDNKELEVKDFQKTTIKCKFGELEILRRRYKYKINGQIEYVYLLDKYLELGYFGEFSTNIVEIVIKEVTEKSYRETAETIKRDTNTTISPTAVRNIVLKFGEKIEEIETEKLKFYESGMLEGERIQEIIFGESDGIFIAKQNRNNNKKSRKGKKIKSEIKIGIIHEGFEKRYSNDYKIKNKQVISTTKKVSYFRRLINMTIGTTYNENKIDKIITNADGAGWAQNLTESPKERYQLDMFHIQKKIRDSVKDVEYIKLMAKVVKTKKPTDIFSMIFNYKVELEHDEKIDELEKVKELEKYLKNNEKGLLRYQYNLGLTDEELKIARELKYRNLGTEESQMYVACRKRMKKNRTSWGDIGAEAMVKLISYKLTNTLEDILYGKIKEDIERQITEREPEVKKIKKVKLGKIIYAGTQNIAACFTGKTKQYAVDMLRGKSFTELMLRY